MKKYCVLAAAAMALSFAAALPSMAQNTSAPDANGVTVDDRPAVGLVLLTSLMSGRSRVGEPVHFETLACVYDHNHDVLIPAGCLAMGHVTRSVGSGMFGKRGQLQFTCEYVILPSGDHVPLTGSKLGAPGANGEAATAAVTVLVSPLGLLIKGGTAKDDHGTPIVMYIADGAKIDPTQNTDQKIRADVTLRGKHAEQIDGLITDFDGDNYTVKTETDTRTLSLDDIAWIDPENLPDTQSGIGD